MFWQRVTSYTINNARSITVCAFNDASHADGTLFGGVLGYGKAKGEITEALAGARDAPHAKRCEGAQHDVNNS